jgi:hypothetical protein
MSDLQRLRDGMRRFTDDRDWALTTGSRSSWP